jgi:lipoyl(octanoyl) transferase
LVSALENSVIQLLAEFNISAEARADAPGVYVQHRKIASVGLRLKNQSCYHGLSLNVDMDLSPFNTIDPCGYRGLEVTQAKDLGINLSLSDITEKLVSYLHRQLNY